MNYLLILLNVIFLVAGQILWKISVKNIVINSPTSIINVLISPWFICGGILYVIATCVWVYLLSKLPLSFLYPMQSLAYVFGLIVAMVIFKEYVPAIRWVGVSVILLGVYLVARS
jgi:drug/metabolite transporter (DMT)-like permease